MLRQLCQKCSNIRQRILQMVRQDQVADGVKESEDNQPFPDNPCIPYLRAVVEQLLDGRKIAYRDMNLVMIDGVDNDSRHTCEAVMDATGEKQATDEAKEIEEEEIENYQTSIWLAQKKEHLDEQLDSILRQLATELNHLQIRTDRSAYFEEFCQNMFEENGLVVQVEGKGKRQFPRKSVVLDMETEGSMMTELLREDIIYLPIYKKPWQIAQNLDITVPIGYNTVIVKGAIEQIETSHSDKFEREFYDSVERM